ncbi:hypothetical protein AGDE_17110 [Angomonas deanei]|nr:hypothetical protein AGDE_17110 [Angomonas deanei]|eukprot:EPY15458.1 hypothetical protein AGDE_17110 [Angomonas deanei]
MQCVCHHPHCVSLPVPLSVAVVAVGVRDRGGPHRAVGSGVLETVVSAVRVQAQEYNEMMFFFIFPFLTLLFFFFLFSFFRFPLIGLDTL